MKHTISIIANIQIGVPVQLWGMKRNKMTPVDHSIQKDYLNVKIAEIRSFNIEQCDRGGSNLTPGPLWASTTYV